MVLEIFNVKDPIVDFYIFFCYNIIEKKRKVIILREKIKQKLGTVHLTSEDFNMICKDRMDFGFDSIYFRYAEAIQELSFFKEMEERRNGKDFNREAWAHGKLMHFYNALEQLTRAHEEEYVDKIDIESAKKVFQEFAKIANDTTGGM